MTMVAILFAAYSGLANAAPANVLVFGDRSGDQANLATDLTTLGHTVTNVSTLPTDLAAFDPIWRVGAFAALSAAERTRLSTFRAADGGLHLTDERPCCEVLNDSLELLVNSVVSAGGITVGDVSGPYPFNPNALGVIIAPKKS